MKLWIVISLGFHLGALGLAAVRPVPSRNFTPLVPVTHVSLVSMPAVESRPAAPADARVEKEPEVRPAEKKPEPVRPEPDPDAVKPAEEETRRKEPEVPKPQPEPEPPQVEPEASEEDPGDGDGDEDAGGTVDTEASAPGTPVAVSALGTSGTQGAVSLDAVDFGFSYYLVSLQAKVAAEWFPPGSVGAPGEILRAVVGFRVMRSGGIEAVEIEDSSGVPYFDRCALQAIRRASPLAPLPEAFEEDELGVHFEFRHTIPPR